MLFLRRSHLDETNQALPLVDARQDNHRIEGERPRSARKSQRAQATAKATDGLLRVHPRGCRIV